MDIQDILAAVDDLSPDDLARLKARIAVREQATLPPRTAEEWQTVLDKAIDAFWEDSTPEEMQTLAAAMSTKLVDPRAWTDEA
jgi:hypothetical protein